MEIAHQFSALVFAARHLVEKNSLASAALLLALLCVLASSVWYGLAAHAVGLAQRELKTIAPVQPASAVFKTDDRRQLARFESSHLVTILNRSARSAGLHLREINLTLDDAPNQPFLRYRATFSMVVDYAGLRRFAAETLAESNDITFDGVSCARGDLKTAELNCDFMFGEVYRKDANG